MFARDLAESWAVTIFGKTPLSSATYNAFLSKHASYIFTIAFRTRSELVRVDRAPYQR